MLFDQAMRRLRAGATGEAVGLLQQALQLDPNHADSLSELGLLAHRSGRGDLARSFLARAAAAAPRAAEPQFNLGLVLVAQGALDEAAAAFVRAVELKPGFAQAWQALGNVRQRQGANAEAEADFRRAIESDPTYAEAWMNLGNALRDQGKLEGAEQALKRALELKPGLVMARRNLAIVHRDQGRARETIAAFDQTLKLQPDFPEAESGRLFSMNYDPEIADAAIAQAHRDWGRRQEARAGVRQPHANLKEPERPLRIGYVSGDFCAHPVGYFLARVLEAHDPAAVQAICYANGTRIDDMTRRLEAAAAGWRDISRLDDAQAEALVRADGVDILVDLSGHTARNRLALFNRRPAPVQASWLGYVATTGLPAIDYLITDLDTAPPGSEALFAETLVRLPHGRFCYAPPAAPAPNAAAGRPFTFGSFNDLLKVGDGVIATWAKVLHAARGSRLRLKWSSLDDAGVRERVLGAFAGRGIEAERIELSGYSPHATMLAEYGEIDLALDPFPFCGALTTCEAMWMGVPVVTWPGERPASRQSLAMLKVLGLGELAASSADDYVAIATGLARDPARLAELKRGLRDRMSASPLCRGEVITATLEAAFRGMWRRRCAGEAPRSFDVQ